MTGSWLLLAAFVIWWVGFICAVAAVIWTML
jgi:hypothetical protein